MRLVSRLLPIGLSAALLAAPSLAAPSLAAAQSPAVPIPAAGLTGTGDPSQNDRSQGDPAPSDPGSGLAAPTGPSAGVSAPLPAELPAPAATPAPAPLPGLQTAPQQPRPRRNAIRATPITTGETVPGSVAAVLPSGRAVPPADAPYAVKLIIWTANRLIGLPYRYGGGHGDFADNAYDCSGAVSYALHAAGVLLAPQDSTSLERWGTRGAGRWLSVYASRDHAWLIVAGLRLDTSPVDDPLGIYGPRWRPAPRPRAGFRVRHVRGL